MKDTGLTTNEDEQIREDVYKRQDRDYSVITKEIPFFIENSKVGNYLKIFVKNGGQFIPIIDCTEFEIESKKYFEVNINKFYLKLLDYFFHGKTPEKFKSFESNFNFNVENSFSEFIDSQENIRVVSLFDCLIQLSSNHKMCIRDRYSAILNFLRLKYQGLVWPVSFFPFHCLIDV